MCLENSECLTLSKKGSIEIFGKWEEEEGWLFLALQGTWLRDIKLFHQFVTSYWHRLEVGKRRLKGMVGEMEMRTWFEKWFGIIFEADRMWASVTTTAQCRDQPRTWSHSWSGSVFLPQLTQLRKSPCGIRDGSAMKRACCCSRGLSSVPNTHFEYPIKLLLTSASKATIPPSGIQRHPSTPNTHTCRHRETHIHIN